MVQAWAGGGDGDATDCPTYSAILPTADGREEFGWIASNQGGGAQDRNFKGRMLVHHDLMTTGNLAVLGVDYHR